jgi:hypothetical protein
MENWKGLNQHIWNSLERSSAAPDAMYAELYRYFARELGFDSRPEPTPEPTPAHEQYKRYELAINDPEVARTTFKEYSVPPNEAKCITILEGYHGVLSQIDAKLAEKYYQRLQDFIFSHNLRYALTPDCKLTLSIEGLLVSQCARLRKALANNRDRLDCLKELEDSLAKINHDNEERNSIRIASNLLEGIVRDRSSNREETLSRAIDGCGSLFPHHSLKETYKDVYRFASDYPNVRHAGNPASRVRNLKKDDALLVIAMTVGMTLFIAENDASSYILQGQLEY